MEGPPELKGARARLWHDWFRARFAANVRYDEIARGVLCATSRDGEDVRGWVQHEAERGQSLRTGAKSDYVDRSSLDLFWRRIIDGETAPVEPLAERLATTFLGIRIECARCHKHPFDRWTQADYRSFANIVADVRFGLSPDGLAAVASLIDDRRKSDPKGSMAPIPRLREVYLDRLPSRRFVDPITGRPLAPRALGGPELSDDGDPRERLFAWLTAPGNPYFASSFVNRVWAVYFGVGLVDPVEGFSVTNPPSNARLLDVLAADFVEPTSDRHKPWRGTSMTGGTSPDRYRGP